MQNYKRILVINPFGIGDVLFSTPIIKTLREKYPRSYIAYICNRRIEPTLINNPKIDEVFVFEKDEYRNLWKAHKLKCIIQFLKFLSVIKKRNFDLSLDLSLGDRYSFFLKVLGVRRRVGFNYKNRGRFQTDKLNIEGFENKHVVEYYFDLLKIVGIEDVPGKLEVFLNEKDKIWADNFLKYYNVNKNDLLIGIAPAGGESFGKWAYIKRWPVEYFAQVSDRLINEFRAKIVILAGQKEREVVLGLLSLMKNKPIDVTNSSSMQLAAIIEKCNLVICNDTGPMRFANAFGKKIIAIFGPTDEKVYGFYPPQTSSIVVRSKDSDCGPCYKKFKLSSCLGYEKCMAKISVDEVFDACKAQLKD